MKDIRCDYCHRPAELVAGDVLYPHRPDLADKKFWRCMPCKAWTGCHEAPHGNRRGLGDGTVPLGRLANAQLRQAKQRAHAAFDILWKQSTHRYQARQAAYGWLAAQLGIPVGDCHIGMMNVEGCLEVERICRTAPNLPKVT